MNALHVSNLLRQDPTVRVLDVRTPGEFGNAHIQGAYNVPLDLLACGMGLLLAKLPYNRFAATCDTEAIVRQFLSSDAGSR